MRYAPILRMNAFVLAGGRSTRMGRDKAMLLWKGRPLIEHALDRLRALGSKPCILGNRPDLDQYAQVIPDNFPGSGPLGGIEAALSATDTDLNLFLPIDLPLLPLSFLSWIAERAAITEAAATIPQIQGRAQPLCAIYNRALLAGVRSSLEHGDGKVMRAVEDSACKVGMRIDRFDVEAIAAACMDTDPWPRRTPIHRWFENMNAPSDLERVSLEQMPHIH